MIRSFFYNPYIIAIALTFPSGSLLIADTVTDGFLTLNPWLDDTTSGDPLDPPEGVHWSFNDPWFFEPNVFSGAALFITSANNQPGFYAAEASAIDLTTQTNVTSLEGYDPSTTKLTGLTFHDPWRVGHYGTVPLDGEYNYFIEFTIDTPAGFYRATTQKLDRATAFQNTIAQLGFNFTWETGGFLGDPFAGGNGIPLDQISNIDYNVLIEVLTPTSGGDGFFNVEGFNLEYEVSSATVTGLLGDFNDDGMVDAADYTVWRDNEGAAEDGSVLSGNGNGGTVDETDYALWRDNYGSSASSATATSTSVPEPATALMLIATVSFAWLRRSNCI